MFDGTEVGTDLIWLHRPDDQLHGACCGPRPVRFCNLESWSWFDSIGLGSFRLCKSIFVCVVCVWCKCVCSNKLAVSLWHHPSIRNHQHSVFSCVFKAVSEHHVLMGDKVIKHSIQPGQLKNEQFSAKMIRGMKSENLQISLSRQWHLLLWLPQQVLSVCTICACLEWPDLFSRIHTIDIYWIMCSLIHSNIKFCIMVIFIFLAVKLSFCQKNKFGFHFIYLFIYNFIIFYFVKK